MCGAEAPRIRLLTGQAMDLDTFLLRAQPSRVKRLDDGAVLASCPCRDHGQGRGDRRPSLSISAARNGGVVLSCHAGCRTEDIVAAFGLTMADLMGDKEEPNEPLVVMKKTRKIAATYTYRDEDGNRLYQVIRYEPKDFLQRRPDGHGDWVWKLGDVCRVLYRLPELIAAVAARQPVFVCEGEKDVEAIVSAGGIATCNPHGAGRWRDEFSPFLHGADVTIVADRDKPGYDHAAAIAASLESCAAAVRIVEAAVGKDAADHLAAGKTLEDFVNVGQVEVGAPAPKDDAAAPPQGAAPPSRRLKLVPMAEVVAVPVEWLWEARIPRGKLSVVAGDPGLGKSYLTLWMCAVISRGGLWPEGGRATPAEVLIVSAEDDAADTIRPRLDRLGADVSRITLIDGVLMDGAEPAQPFSLKMHVDLLREAIVEKDAALVIVDPLNAFLGGIDSYKAAEVRGVLSPLAHVAAATHAAVLAVHHLNKGTSSNALYRASGSLDFVAAARIVHGVAADPEVEGRRVFVPVKCNIAAMPEGLGFGIGEEGVVFDELPVTLDAAAAFTTRSVDHEERSEREMAKDFLRDELADGPVPVATLLRTASGYDISKSTLRRAAGDLHVRKAKQGYQGAWLWSLPEDPVGAEASQDTRPQDVSTFVTFGDSGLDRGAGMSTFGTTEPPGDDHRPSEPTDPGDDRGSKDDHVQGALSLDDVKDDHGKGRDTFDDAEPSGPDLDGTRDGLVVDCAVAPLDVDEGDHPDELAIPPVAVDLFRQATSVVVATRGASIRMVARRCGCSDDEAVTTLSWLERIGIVSPLEDGHTARDVLIEEADVDGIVAAYAALVSAGGGAVGADLVLAPSVSAAAVPDDGELLI